MRILILGISGMLGHAVWLNLKDKHETYGTVRGSAEDLTKKCSLFQVDDKNIIQAVDVLRDEDIERALDATTPDVIINSDLSNS